MAKLTLTSLLGGMFSRNSLNSNFTKIETELNSKVLYRDNPDGEPNSMENELDMNSNKIVNVAAPSSNADVANKKYVDDIATGAQTATANGTFDSIDTDVIDEKTTDAGVTIESVLLKDGNVTAATSTATTAVVTDTINERTADAGVTIDSVLLKDGEFTADTVNADVVAEKTNGAGVTIDGVLIKDTQIKIGDQDHESADDLSISLDSGAQIGLGRVSNDAEDADFVFRKARGSAGSLAAVQTNDNVGTIFWTGHDGTNYHNYANLIATSVNSTLGAESGKLTFGASRAGTLTALLTLAGGGTTPALRPKQSTTVNLGDDTAQWNDIQSATISMQDGAAATPAYTFADDTSKDTGFYRAAEDTVGFANAGAVTMFTTPTQRVVVGAAATEVTTGNTVNPKVQITGTTGAGATFGINKFSSDTSPARINMMKSRSGTVGGVSACSVGDNIGEIVFSFDDGTDYTRYAASIKSQVSGGGLVGNLVFRPGGDVNRFEMDEDGNFLPIQASNTQDLGANLAANAFENCYLQNAVTVVSDTSFKANQEDLDEAERKAFLEVALNIKKYNRIKPGLVREETDEAGKTTVVELTDEERIEKEISIGVIAQDVVAIFEKHGLNAFDYRVVKEMQDGKLMVSYDHLQSGAINAIAHGTTL